MLAMMSLSGTADVLAKASKSSSGAARGLSRRAAALDAGGAARERTTMASARAPDDSAAGLAATLLALCEAAGTGRSIDPAQIAQAYERALGEDGQAWRRHLGKVREAAVMLALAGRVVILRKGKPADPQAFRGVYRLTRADAA